MKKNKKIMIWGSNLFLGLSFNSKGSYVYLASSCIMQLNNKYNVSNFSMNKLSSEKALNYLSKALKYDDDFDAAILELGFQDLIDILNKKYDLEFFYDNLVSMVEILKERNIKTYLTTLSPFDFEKFAKKNDIPYSKDISVMHKRINRSIKSIALDYHLELFDDNRALSKNKEEYVSEDGICLNPSGQNVLANMINRKNI